MIKKYKVVIERHVKMNTLIEHRLNVSHQLVEGKCGGSYPDAVIILVSIISAIAAKLWPGDRKDRKRFIETIIKYADNNLKAEYISIPLLLQDLKITDNKTYEILKDRFRFFGSMRIFEGADIDKCEDKIIELSPDLSLKTIRKFSYANILYSEVRNGLIHEYKTSEKVAKRVMHDFSNSVSYVNNVHLFPYNSFHTIYFHYEWIEKIVISMKESLKDEWQNIPFLDPQNWWISG